MPSLEQPCLLRPGGGERSTVYVCLPVDPTLATHSSVLETLTEFSGLVDLPAGVSFGDFEEWSATVAEGPSKLTLEGLCSCIQTAEKLGANNTAQLVKAFAAKVRATCWEEKREKEAMLQAWLRLSSDAQKLVLCTLPKVYPNEVCSWPTTMQQTLMDTWISRGRFHIASGHYPNAVLSFLALLARTDPALPGLTALSLDCAIPTAEAASNLSAALLHHPALEHLSMRSLSWAPSDPSPPAVAVLRTLPQLTAITSITLSAAAPASSPLSAEDAIAAVEVMRAMAAAVSALPRLAEFHLCSPHSNPKDTRAAHAEPSTPKRRKFAAYMGPYDPATRQPPFAPVIAALSAAPVLTHLTLPAAYDPCGHSHPPPGSGVRFTTLQSLTLVGGHRHSPHQRTAGTAGHPSQAAAEEAAEACMPVLTSASPPLPALTALRFCSEDPMREVDGPSIQQVFANAARCPVLKLLDLKIGPCPTAGGGEGLTLRAFVGVGDDVQVPMAAVAVTACVPHDVQQAVLEGLVTLHDQWPALDTLCVCFGAGSLANADMMRAVGSMMRALTSLTHLRCIEFDPHSCKRDDVRNMRALCVYFLSVPLRAFRMLTYVGIVVPPEYAVPLAAVAKHLAGVPALQNLCVQGVVHGGVHEFEACFAPLTTVTSLEIACRPVTADIVRAFARVVAGMPGLTCGFLQSCCGPATNPAVTVEGLASVDWFHGLLDLPCRGEYGFGCCNEDVPQGEVERVKQQLTARGASFWDGLKRFRFTSEPDGCSNDEPPQGAGDCTEVWGTYTEVSLANSDAPVDTEL